MVRRAGPLHHPLVLVCEGDDDAAFFRHLIRARQMHPFDIWTTSDLVDTGGHTQLTAALDGLATTTGFESVKGVVLALDADDKPITRLQEVQKAIGAARELVAMRGTGTAPRAVEQIFHGTPALAIWLMPGPDQAGCLETLCVEAARRANSAVLRCVDPFLACIDLGGLNLSARAKAELRTLIVTSRPKEANRSVAYLWTNAPGTVPVGDVAFDAMAAFPTRFAAAVLAA
jgi:hypothetical protein